MGETIDLANEYFNSLNPISQKIVADVKKYTYDYGPSWDELDVEKQESLLTEFIIDPDIQAKYEVDKGFPDIPDVFPHLKILGGEKILVDFDNDGWTWRDEHSGPFSWETRSQLELCIFDDEDEGICCDKRTTPDLIPSKECRKSNSRPRKPPPPTPEGISFTPERSIWEGPFLAADREEHTDLIHKFDNILKIRDDQPKIHNSQPNSEMSFKKKSLLHPTGPPPVPPKSTMYLPESRLNQPPLTRDDDMMELSSEGLDSPSDVMFSCSQSSVRADAPSFTNLPLPDVTLDELPREISNHGVNKVLDCSDNVRKTGFDFLDNW